MPAPPVQLPVVAPPVMVPAKVAVGLLEQTVWSGPAFTRAARLIVIVTESLTAGQGPAGSAEVRVSVTVVGALAISPWLGVYCAFSLAGLSNDPLPPLQVPVLAPPITVPAKVAIGLLEHSAWSGPALTTAAGLMAIVIVSATGGHGSSCPVE